MNASAQRHSRDRRLAKLRPIQAPKTRTTLTREQPWSRREIGKLANRLGMPVTFDLKQPGILVLYGHATKDTIEQLVGPVQVAYTDRLHR